MEVVGRCSKGARDVMKQLNLIQSRKIPLPDSRKSFSPLTDPFELSMRHKQTIHTLYGLDKAEPFAAKSSGDVRRSRLQIQTQSFFELPTTTFAR